MWPALISAGATLFGSLFGSGSRKQETVSRVDYKRMVRDAEAAGFNPLTALRNGGAAGFSISTTPAAPLSARLADGLSAGVSNFLANFDPMADDKREAEFQLVQAQIRNLNAQSSALSQSFNVPGYGADVIERRPSGTAGQLSKALPGAFRAPAVETPTLTNPWPSWAHAHVAPFQPDASAAEERYGEVLGSVFGAGVLGQDVVYNIYRGSLGVANWASNNGKGVLSKYNPIKWWENASDAAYKKHVQRMNSLHQY